MDAWYKIAVGGLTVVFVGTIERLIRKGKLQRAKTYSYRSVLIEGVRWLVLSTGLSAIVYIFSGSLEASLTLEAFLFALVVSGCVKALFVERKIKKRN